MSAQEEFNQLVNNNRDKASSHPEDRDSSPHFSDDDPSRPRNLRQRRVLDSDDEDADENMVSSRSNNYHIPNTVFDANTGPKGVIADAQAFERARKKSFRKTLLSAAGFDGNGSAFGKTRDEAPKPTDSSSGSEDDEERFLRKWRVSRMQELQNRGMRRPSPRGRRYGAVETVDAAGYLDAIEKVTPDTVVVVCIYDPQVCSTNPSSNRFLLSPNLTLPCIV
jgi:hypothetical protein